MFLQYIKTLWWDYNFVFEPKHQDQKWHSDNKTYVNIINAHSPCFSPLGYTLASKYSISHTPIFWKHKYNKSLFILFSLWLSLLMFHSASTVVFLECLQVMIWEADIWEN